MGTSFVALADAGADVWTLDEVDRTFVDPELL